jgi:DNA-directed RNA polymerase delta subunit
MENNKNSKINNASGINISFVDCLKILMEDLPKRSQEIIFNRYGITGKKAMTLEGIGKKYGITRERVRQVVREVFRKIKEKKNELSYLKMSEAVEYAISENSGIIEKNELLVFLGRNDLQEKGAIAFFLECLDNVTPIEIKGEILKSYLRKDFDLELWKKIKNGAKDILEKKGESLKNKEFVEETISFVKDLKLEEKILMDFIRSSEEIKKNSFDKWGLLKWREVSPKGTRDKAHLVLKEADKPLHFRIIAEHIDKYGLNKKKTHPQTVHNELIKDSNFILVGRGIYALSKWGYKKGTVKDVIKEILLDSKRPLTKEEILKKVLDIRYVKKSTVVINLNNFFKKTELGYTLKR